MKKFFTFVAALMAVVAVNATVVTLTPGQFTAGENLENFSETVSGITVAIAPKTTITADQIRVFKNSTITISAEKEISGIVFTCTANGETKYGPGCFTAQDGYSFEGKVGTWAGTPALSVAFEASANQVRATKIEVYLDGEVPEAPTPQEVIQATVAEAIAIGQALQDGQTTDEVYAVTGFVVNAEPFSADHKNQIWWMADDAENTGAQEFEAYACTVSEDKVIMQVLNGDQVTLTGSITKYNDTKNSRIIIEIKNGTAVFVSKVDGDHSIEGGGDPGEDITPEVPEGVLTCAAAVEFAATVPEEPTAEQKEVEVGDVVVRGFVSFCYDLKPGETQQSAWLADLKSAKAGVVQAYYAEVTEAVAKGDYVEAAGKLVKYFKAGKDGKPDEIILEIKNGTMKKVDPLAVENVFTTVKAQKVMMNGTLYIIRGNKMFDVRGAQVR